MTDRLTATAEKIARLAHAGRLRIVSAEPYINHPVRVAAAVEGDLKIAALLHDVLEDSDLSTPDLIAAGIPPEIVAVVLTLTRSEDETYFDYIRRVKRDPAARTIKLADLADNLRDVTSDSLRLRYERARAILMKA